MIIQALSAYYDRAVRMGLALPQSGLEKKRIPFLVKITQEGAFKRILDTREDKKAKEYLVPQSGGRSVNIAANLLWDNIEYALGCTEGGDAPDEGRVPQCHQSFIEAVKTLHQAAPDLPQLAALLAFLQTPDKTAQMRSDPVWNELVASRANTMSFIVGNGTHPICANPAIHQRLTATDATDAKKSLCIVSGEQAPISRLHQAVKGVAGAKTTGANIVSFNMAPFCSYGKEQGANSPIAQSVAFNYTTALNHLLDYESPQKCRIGGSTIAFWAREKSAAASAFEEQLSAFFTGGGAPQSAAKDAEQNTPKTPPPNPQPTLFADPPPAASTPAPTPADNPNAGVAQMKALLEAVHTAINIADYNSDKFYILGLSPNAARIAIRFWHKTTVKKLAQNIKDYFDNIAIIPQYNSQDEKLSIHQILRGVSASAKKAKKSSENATKPAKGDAKPPKKSSLSPILTGQFISAIMMGHPYPRALLQAVIIRCRAERDVPHERAAAIKAWLISHLRSERHRKSLFERAPAIKAWFIDNNDPKYPNFYQEKLKMLDPTFKDPAYVSGRIFAILERIQEVASPTKLNATVKDKYYGRASTAPSTVFPRLLATSNHHIGKLDEKQRIFFEKLKGEALNLLDGRESFPRMLDLEQQGRFALGYYHQRQHFFTKKQHKEESHA